MIDLTKLRDELAQIRSLQDWINADAAVKRHRPTRGQWETLLGLAVRESEITAVLNPECITL